MDITRNYMAESMEHCTDLDLSPSLLPDDGRPDTPTAINFTDNATTDQPDLGMPCSFLFPHIKGARSLRTIPSKSQRP
jgi:hypothetical protein